MKLNTVVVYDMRMCMKEEYFGSEKYNGDNSREIIIYGGPRGGGDHPLGSQFLFKLCLSLLLVLYYLWVVECCKTHVILIIGL